MGIDKFSLFLSKSIISSGDSYHRNCIEEISTYNPTRCANVKITYIDVSFILYQEYYNTKIYKNSDNFMEILSNNIVEILKKYIENLYNPHILTTVYIVFDGIPSLSKIIEQSKRRTRNFYDSIEKERIKGDRYYYEDNENKLSLGPQTPLVLFIENYIKNNLLYDNIDIIINSSKINGEADTKILYYLTTSNVKCDYCIQTNDSDFIFHMLLQQLNNDTYNYKKNIIVMKHSKSDILYIFNSKSIIHNLTNMIKDIPNRLSLYNLLAIFMLFGNDHLPQLYEIGPELSLTYYINLIQKVPQIIIKDRINWFALYRLLKLININKELNITKIILIKFFKISTNLISFFIDKLEYTFIDILKFMKLFIIYKSLQLTNEELNNLYDDDLRKTCEKNSKLLNNTIFNPTHPMHTTFINHVPILESYISYYEHKYNGLCYYTKPLTLSSNANDNIYNYISATRASDIYSIENYIDVLNNRDSIMDTHKAEAYLKKLGHIVYNYALYIKDPEDRSSIYYPFNKPPLLSSIISYIETYMNTEELYNDWLIDYDKNILSDRIINAEEHYKLISPFVYG